MPVPNSCWGIYILKGVVALPNTSPTSPTFKTSLVVVSSSPNSPSTQNFASLPMHDLPTELLQSIFKNAALSCDRMERTRMLFRLAGVSGTWRDCIMDTPSLWTTICIKETLQTTTASLQRMIQRVNAQMRLSKSFPLIIDIMLDTDSENTENADLIDGFPDFLNKLVELSQVFYANATRIREFYLLVEDSFCTATILLRALFQVPMPMLQKWAVRRNITPDSTDSSVDKHLDLTYSFHPNLRIVSFDSMPVRWSSFSPNTLTTLEITFLHHVWRPSMPELGNILYANRNSLERLTLLASVSKHEAPLPSTISLPMLQFLALGFCETLDIVPFLNSIEVPNLKTLAISHFDRPDLQPEDDLDLYFDPGVEQLFSAISRRLPLSQIVDLTLGYIVFCQWPPVHNTALENFWLAVRKTTEFFRSLTGLKVLTLREPDTVTIPALHEAHIKPFAPRATHFSSPYMVDFFVLTHLSSDAHDALLTLILDMPEEWFHYTQWKTAPTDAVDDDFVSRCCEVEMELFCEGTNAL